MIAVIDYGIGNVRSVINALEHVGAQARLTRDLADLRVADGLVLPGVGAFGEGMRRLAGNGLTGALRELARSGRPILGICLGFQMLMRSSEEMGQHEGLGLIEADVVRLPVRARLPHVGWASVHAAPAPEPPRLLRGLDRERFYFVHSFGVVGSSFPFPAGLTAVQGLSYAALVESGSVFGTQFHPEKSGEAGLAMLRNFLDLCS